MSARRRMAMLALAVALTGCGPAEIPPATETVAAGELVLSVRGEGELRSAKPTPLTVPGSNWSSRQVQWMLPEGSVVRKGDLLAKFSAPEGEQELAQALIDLQHNALSRAAKEAELATTQGRVAVDLSTVQVQLGIARRYADAELSAIARNEVLDAIEDVEFLQTKQGTLEWQRSQSGVRGGAELAVLDAQRSTHDLNARARQSDLDALELRAPNDGVLLLSANWSGDKPMVGSTLRAGFEFGTLPDTAAMEVQIDLPQIEAQGLQPGAVVELHPLGRPQQKLTTALSWVASAAKVKGRQSPVKYLSMRAPVAADAIARFGLVPGQRLVATVFLAREPDALSVANVAVEQREGRSFVQVHNGRRFEPRAVELGIRGSARSQVLEGLEEGDVVLLSAGGEATPANAAEDADAGGGPGKDAPSDAATGASR